MTSRSGGSSSSASCWLKRPRSPCRASIAASAKRRDQAVGARLARAGERQGGAVVGRGADEGQPERDVHALVEGERLDGISAWSWYMQSAAS